MEELLGFGVGGVVHDIGRGAVLGDSAMPEQRDAVGGAVCEAHLVCCHENRGTLLLELRDHLEDLADQQRIERRRYLVKQQKLRVGHERTCDCHALLLATREAIGILAGLLLHADALEKAHGLLLGTGTVPLVDLANRERDVVQNRHVRKEVELLKDHANARAGLVLVDARIRDVGVAKPDLSVINLLKQVDTLHERGLARAGGAEQCDDLMLAYVKGDVIEDEVIAEPLDHAVDPQDLLVIAWRHGRAIVLNRVSHQTMPPVCSRERSLAEYQSLSKMKGTLIMMKSRLATT